MFKKLNNLSFVIGIFFTVVSVILFVNIFVTGRSDALSIYTSSGFLVFGLVMMIKG